MRFRSDASTLRSFCRAIGDVEVDNVEPEAVLAFIAGRGPVTAYWRQKFRILGSFYRYALGRGYTATSPLPTSTPKFPPPLTPYIYSVSELEKLLTATDILQTPNSPLQQASFRTLLLLLYSTGLRISEALALRLSDVDLGQQLLTVRDTKFFKTRLVPIGPRLTTVLADYASRRRRLPLPAGEGSSFLATRTGRQWHYRNVNKLFGRVREAAGIRRESSARYQPRIHDLRHTAAVHRVIAWYRAGANVQQLLPQLATYLGHVELASTQRYLHMTTELLHEANRRFEQYAQPEVRHE
jgi:site-specific recombinase XerD